MINISFMKNRSAMFFSSLCACSISLALIAGPTFGDGINEASLKIYEIDGNVDHFDRERLESFPQIEFKAETLWTSQEDIFKGPSLKSVLETVGIIDGEVEIAAANGYTIKMFLDTDPYTEDYPIVTTRMNGQEFPIWEKGPLWLMFPFKDVPGDQIERANALSVWQITSIRQLADAGEIDINSGKF